MHACSGLFFFASALSLKLSRLELSTACPSISSRRSRPVATPRHAAPRRSLTNPGAGRVAQQRFQVELGAGGSLRCAFGGTQELLFLLLQREVGGFLESLATGGGRAAECSVMRWRGLALAMCAAASHNWLVARDALAAANPRPLCALCLLRPSPARSSSLTWSTDSPRPPPSCPPAARRWRTCWGPSATRVGALGCRAACRVCTQCATHQGLLPACPSSAAPGWLQPTCKARPTTHLPPWRPPSPPACPRRSCGQAPARGRHRRPVLLPQGRQRQRVAAPRPPPHLLLPGGQQAGAARPKVWLGCVRA